MKLKTIRYAVNIIHNATIAIRQRKEHNEEVTK